MAKSNCFSAAFNASILFSNEMILPLFLTNYIHPFDLSISFLICVLKLVLSNLFNSTAKEFFQYRLHLNFLYKIVFILKCFLLVNFLKKLILKLIIVRGNSKIGIKFFVCQKFGFYRKSLNIFFR